MKRRVRILMLMALLSGGLSFAFTILVLGGWIRQFRVPTGAMSPAIQPGDFVVMEGLTYVAGDPARGDIVIFRGDDIRGLQPATKFIMRVAALPGERVKIEHGAIWINGERVEYGCCSDEEIGMPALLPGYGCHVDLVVPKDHYYVLGDHHSNSLDSRYWGCMPRDHIDGRAVWRSWPASRAGRLDEK